MRKPRNADWTWPDGSQYTYQLDMKQEIAPIRINGYYITLRQAIHMYAWLGKAIKYLELIQSKVKHND